MFGSKLVSQSFTRAATLLGNFVFIYYCRLNYELNLFNNIITVYAIISMLYSVFFSTIFEISFRKNLFRNTKKILFIFTSCGFVIAIPILSTNMNLQQLMYIGCIFYVYMAISANCADQIFYLRSTGQHSKAFLFEHGIPVYSLLILLAAFDNLLNYDLNVEIFCAILVTSRIFTLLIVRLEQRERSEQLFKSNITKSDTQYIALLMLINVMTLNYNHILIISASYFLTANDFATLRMSMTWGIVFSFFAQINIYKYQPIFKNMTEFNFKEFRKVQRLAAIGTLCISLVSWVIVEILQIQTLYDTNVLLLLFAAHMVKYIFGPTLEFAKVVMSNEGLAQRVAKVTFSAFFIPLTVWLVMGAQYNIMVNYLISVILITFYLRNILKVEQMKKIGIWC